MDDTVDEFGNLATGVVKALAKHDYTTPKYKKFYTSLLHIFYKEKQLFEALSKEDRDDLNTVVLSKIEYIEHQINGSMAPTEITEESQSSTTKLKKVQPESQPLLAQRDDTRFSMSFIQKTRPSLEERDNFNTVMHLLVIVLSELNAGCIEF